MLPMPKPRHRLHDPPEMNNGARGRRFDDRPMSLSGVRKCVERVDGEPVHPTMPLAAAEPMLVDQARGRWRWNVNGVYDTADGGGCLRMFERIAPTTCISHGLQSKRSV
jgi:hypothetical protein